MATNGVNGAGVNGAAGMPGQKGVVEMNSPAGFDPSANKVVTIGEALADSSSVFAAALHHQSRVRTSTSVFQLEVRCFALQSNLPI